MHIVKYLQSCKYILLLNFDDDYDDNDSKNDSGNIIK